MGSRKRTWLAQLCLSEIQGYFRTRERLPLGLILYPNLEINQILLFEPGKKKWKKYVSSVSIGVEATMKILLCGRQAFGKTFF